VFRRSFRAPEHLEASASAVGTYFPGPGNPPRQLQTISKWMIDHNLCAEAGGHWRQRAGAGAKRYRDDEYLALIGD
jgi:hypothetical protein